MQWRACSKTQKVGLSLLEREIVLEVGIGSEFLEEEISKAMILNPRLKDLTSLKFNSLTLSV